MYSNFNNKFQIKLAVIYTAWVFLWFVGIYLVLFPFQFVFLQFAKTLPWAHKINFIWGKILFFIVGQRVEVEYQFVPQKETTYVFASNHFSYWDIATMGVILPYFFAFMGKSSVQKVPLLGYMFKKLHIKVNREAKDSRMAALNAGINTVKNGRSVVIFVEGGITTENPPQMKLPLKDGAFIMAIQNKAPIVPVTLLTNHQILWHTDNLFQRKPIKAIVHEPIETSSFTTNDINFLKVKVEETIQNALNEYHQ